MAIESISSQQQNVQGVKAQQSSSTFTIGLPEPSPSFSDVLKESILQVNAIQAQADQAIVELTTGKKQDLHQTMIAVEKADVAFQLMMQVRNKIVAAYEEIARMQI